MVVRIASYNTALSREHSGDLLTALESGKDKQILATVALLQEIRADIILLNEVDYDASGKIVNGLVSALQQGRSSLNYPFSFCQPVNTGVPSGRDFDKDGIASDINADALGFGRFPGQYGMVLLSKFPIDHSASRTFQNFLWRDMPNAKLPKQPTGQAWFDEDDLAILPLSSKSHWDVSVQIPYASGEKTNILHCLCSHPTPPAFDGDERRNGCRNHDEVRFWTDYLSNKTYFKDDQGRAGGLDEVNDDVGSFVLLGDLNISPYEGNGYRSVINNLLSHPKMAKLALPTSLGGVEHSPKVNKKYSVHHTAVWRMHADYARPSRDLTLVNQGVFWPIKSDKKASLLKNTSDHRLVYIDVNFITK